MLFNKILVFKKISSKIFKCLIIGSTSSVWGLAGCTPEQQSLPVITLQLNDTNAYDYQHSEAFLLLHHSSSMDTLRMSRNAGMEWNLPVSQLTEEFERPVDSLHFHFELYDNNGTLLKREDKLRRKALNELLDEQPVITFDEPWLPGERYRLHVAVDMRAQKTLGLFRPEDGDQVVVTGSWCDWCDKSAVLTPSGHEEGIWQGEVEVRGTPGSTVQWRFGIDAGRALPGGGYETQTVRETELPQAGGDAPEKLVSGPVWFDDRKRVMRFIVETETGGHQPVLHLYYDDAAEPERSEPLMKVDSDKWEMAFSVPDYVDKVRWNVFCDKTNRIISTDYMKDLSDKGHKVFIEMDNNTEPL